ncbi:hypothetical protein [Streptomyces sp. 4R-3d]|uniref:zinc finger domain-containing protein n=1 Tax=Streptomyces sp. 4R-3d TaxID=2559605 RepID=UPI001430D97C|nr:hypothetical protein [Streptomyces sp. 4R-3d]
MNTNDRAIATTKCPFCGQPAGRQCVAPINDRPLTFAHPSRQFAVLDQKTEEEN